MEMFLECFSSRGSFRAWRRLCRRRRAGEVIEAGEVGNIIKKEKSRFASVLMVAMGNT